MSLNIRMIEEKSVIILSATAAFFTIFLLIVILGTITIRGLPAIDVKYLTSAEIDVQGYGSALGNALIGTILLSTLSVIIATPFALCTAIYLKKYAKENYLTKSIRLLIEMFSGTPSIVVGVVGLILICYYLKPISGGWSLISASTSLAILILPVIERTIEEAVNTVPGDIEHASYALGANKWETISKIVIPYAISGIVTGVIFGIARAAEESAVVILTTGYSQYFPTIGVGHNDKLLFGVQVFPFQEQVGSLTISIYNAVQMPTMASTSSAFKAAFVLIITVLIINMAARLIIWRWKIG